MLVNGNFVEERFHNFSNQVDRTGRDYDISRFPKGANPDGGKEIRHLAIADLPVEMVGY